MSGEVDSKQQTNTSVTKREKDRVSELQKQVSNDWTEIQEWRNKQTTANDQRMGLKKYTNTPYDGAPDIPVPETDKLIKKSVPNLVLSSWKPSKLALVRQSVFDKPIEGIDEKIRKSQKALNAYLKMPYMDWFRKQYLAGDFAKNYGHCLFKVAAEYESEIVYHEIDTTKFSDEELDAFTEAPRAEKEAFLTERYDLDLEDEDDQKIIDDVIAQFEDGKDIIKFSTENIKFKPNIEIPLPTKVFAPTYTTDIDNAERITYEMYKSEHEIEQLIKDGVFRDVDLDVTNGSSKTRSSESDIVEQNKANWEGVSNNQKSEDLYKIYVCNTWFAPEEGASQQRWVFMWLADTENIEEGLLYSKPFQFEFNGWDYEKYDDEVKDPRYYNSRGIGERIRAIQEVLDRSISNMLVRDEMNNVPIWEVEGTSSILDNVSGFAPGEMVPVREVGQEIRQLNQTSSVDVSSERIMALMKAYAEEYASSNDQLFGNSTNQGGADTLGELKAGISLNQGAVSAEIINWNIVIGKVYKKLFNVIKENLTDPLYIDGDVILPSDFQFNAEVVSNGSVESAFEQLTLQRSTNRIAMVERFVQAGVANLDDYYNAAVQWLQTTGENNPEAYTTDPKIMMQEKINQMQQALAQMQQQAEQLKDINDKQQKGIARNQAKMDKDKNKFQGEMSVQIEEGDDVKVTRKSTKTIQG